MSATTGTMMIGVRHLQSVRVKGFSVEVKAVANTWGNTVPLLAVSQVMAEEPGLRALKAFAYRVAALVEELSEGHRWLVRIEDRYARYQIELELFEGTPTEVKEATAVLRRTLKACTEELS